MIVINRKPFERSFDTSRKINREFAPADQGLARLLHFGPPKGAITEPIQRGKMLRISTLIAAATLTGALVAHPASAQDTTTHHGGLNGAARAVSGAAKSTGRAVKSGVHAVGSKTHKVLKKAGRSTKSTLSHAVGDTNHDPNHKPGGLNKAARDVSASIKHVGRSAKAGVHEGASDTHKALQKTGNDVKKSVSDTSHTP